METPAFAVREHLIPLREGQAVSRGWTAATDHRPVAVTWHWTATWDLARCTEPGARVHRCVAYDEITGQPLASGGMSLFPELGFGLLWAGGTVPEARGRGAYSAVVAARVACARELGFSMEGLYARVGSSAPIVAHQGFSRSGRMVCWERPSPRVR